MIFIDYKDSRPIYEQIVEKYKTLILKCVLPPGEQMPSVRKLAMELAANPNTVQKAYAELERQGYLYSVKGRGSFVAENSALISRKEDELTGRLIALLAEAEELGIDPDHLIANARKQKGDTI